MKTILQFSFCFIFLTSIWSFSIGQIDQTSSQTQINPDNIDWSYYKEKMGFSDEIEFTPTGQMEKDQETYLKLVEIRKMTALDKQDATQRPGNSGRSAPPSPPNDLCADAIVVECGSTVSGTTIEATLDNVGFCGTSNTTGGVWYSLTPEADYNVTLSTCNQANYDTKISVFTGDCGNLTCVAGLDDASGCSGFTTLLSFCATANQEYLILVHGFGTATGNFTLSVTCTELPTNDLCSNAIPVNCGEDVQGTTIGSCFDNAGTCGTSNTTGGVWYSLTPEAHGLITLSTCNQANYDTKISVYTDGCEELSCVAGQDDNFPAGCGGFTTELSFCATANQEYLILVHGFGNATGDFTLSISCNLSFLSVDAGECQSRFLGYGPAEEEVNYLCADITGDAPPFTISWSNGESTECIGVQPDETTTYTVEVTDAIGCVIVSDEVTVNVIDISAPCPGNNKVQICHVPPGNPENEDNICVSANAVPSHLENHGDRLGPCENVCLATNENPFPENGGQDNESLRLGRDSKVPVVVFPNPFNQMTTIRFEVPEDTHTTIDIFSATGKKVTTIFDAFVESGIETNAQFDGHNQIKGLYYFVIRTEKGDLAHGKLFLIE